MLLYLILSAAVPVTNLEPIILRAEKLPFTPKEFHIAEIIDERADKKAVAYLIPTVANPAGAKPQPVDLQGGGLAALRDYVHKSMPHNTDLRPVVVRLKEMKVTEKAIAPGRVGGQIAVTMAFELQRAGETVPLLQFKGGGKYERPANRNDVLEPALRQSLVQSFTYLNSWMDKEAATNPKLAKGIQVTFTDYSGKPDQDTVFYEPARPLRWEDFKASPSPKSRFAATVFPGFAYTGETEMVNGVIHLNLAVQVYVLQHSSWVREDSKNAYNLNHEQRHFDIVKLVAERFKRKIRPELLSIEDYNSNIQYHFIESYREMNQLQEQYDAETRHGLDKLAQESWNQRIENELKMMMVR